MSLSLSNSLSCEIRFLSQNVYPVPGTGYTFVYGYPGTSKGLSMYATGE